MSGLPPHRRDWGPLAVTAILAAALISPVPVSAQLDTFGCVTPPGDDLQLNVANPSPGDKVPVGDVVIHGVAYDRSATTRVGVDRVSLFLGRRGAGGAFLGEATLDLPNSLVAPETQFDMAGWAATVTIPNTPGPSTLSVYAHSAVSDVESTVSVPFMIAQDSAAGTQCSSSTTAGTGQSPAESIQLELSNPQPNASVLVGSTNIRVSPSIRLQSRAPGSTV